MGIVQNMLVWVLYRICCCGYCGGDVVVGIVQNMFLLGVVVGIVQNMLWWILW